MGALVCFAQRADLKGNDGNERPDRHPSLAATDETTSAHTMTPKAAPTVRALIGALRLQIYMQQWMERPDSCHEYRSRFADSVFVILGQIDTDTGLVEPLEVPPNV